MGEKKKRAGKDEAAATAPGVSVRISAQLRQRAKVYAVLNGRSLMDVVDEAVSEYLGRRKA